MTAPVAGAEMTCERCGAVGVLEGDAEGWTLRWTEPSARAKPPHCITDRFEREHWVTEFSIVGLDGLTLVDGAEPDRVALVRSLPR